MTEKLTKFKELNREIRGCRKCRLWLTRTHALPGEGNTSSKLILIAQAPGYTEDSEGRMFIGPSGKKLDELFARVHIDREEIFMTNILRCMLPNYRRPRQDEINACTPYLDKEIELIHPKIIGTLGFVSARYIFKKYGIESELKFPYVCGKIFTVKDKKIIPLRHPAALLYNDSLQKEMIKNYGKLRKLLDSV
ncbi:uracil-DNA glycosylase [Candidatus Bathyarchaeota archaeon]|nr:uracil-DNA glycosylase [Candidatus Bathyarchaeota archaeon]